MHRTLQTDTCNSCKAIEVTEELQYIQRRFKANTLPDDETEQEEWEDYQPLRPSNLNAKQRLLEFQPTWSKQKQI